MGTKSNTIVIFEQSVIVLKYARCSIKRKVAIVFLAGDRHGKSSIIGSMFSAGRKGSQVINCGDETFSGYVFIRSYQEVEKERYGDCIEKCLSENIGDEWYKNDFIVISSHIDITSQPDIDRFAYILHYYGYNVIVCYVLLQYSEMVVLRPILIKEYWDKRIEILNEYNPEEWQKNTKEIGIFLHDLLCRELKI